MADDSGVAPLALGNRCYVGNLAWATTTEALTEHFASHGALLSANVMRDDGGRSKGWGLVEYATPEQAAAAIELTNSTELEGRRLLVREDRGDKVKEDRPPRSGRGAGRGDRVGGGEGRGGRGGRGGDREPRGDREHREPRAERAPRPERVENSSGLQIVVQGIPWSFTWKELKELFAESGEVERADVVTGSDGRSRGFGTVRFMNTDAAHAAVQNWHDTELEGRKLAVFLDKYA